ncbi:MAG: serine/threonine protein phosphatase [Proteobacteria bacterium]|nr:serine/threonine protein phosphatase [Pseudomonadota bacterium]
MIRSLAKLLTGGGAAPSASFGQGLESRFGVIPEGQRVYAVGDIHGCSRLWLMLMGEIAIDSKDYKGEVTLIFLGDYIDRGPQSSLVIYNVTESLYSAWASWQKVYLRGNHEQAMLDFLADPKRSTAWLGWGGIQTLESYDVPPYGARGLREGPALAAELQLALTERGHEAFYRQTVLSHTIGGYAFVHAGVRPGVTLESQLENDLLFIREDFIGRPHGLPYRVVFGHTIMPQPLVEADKIGIDTGAFQGGPLTAVVLEGAEVRFIQAA